jgi:hypothetical protein
MKRIDENEGYFFHAVVREGWLGSRSAFACKRILTENAQILKPVYTGAGRSTRIIIKGANISAFRKQLV